MPKYKVIIILIVIALVIAGGASFYYRKLEYPGLSALDTFQSLADPYVSIVEIDPGLRKEEVADRFASAIGWTDAQKQELIRLHTAATHDNSEGYYLPGAYLVTAGTRPKDVNQMILNKFNEDVVLHMPDTPKAVDLETAIKIASIIERETSNPADMPIISGIIQNRIALGMPLAMDSTLQYAKGIPGDWWPKVLAGDTKIDSPYNTYIHTGYPPTAISNPSEAAISAALNPAKTKALFFIHDANGIIHTAVTYEQHLANINRYY